MRTRQIWRWGGGPLQDPPRLGAVAGHDDPGPSTDRRRVEQAEGAGGIAGEQKPPTPTTSSPSEAGSPPIIRVSGRCVVGGESQEERAKRRPIAKTGMS